MSKSKENQENYKFKGVGLSTSERRKAQKRFEIYKQRYHVDSFGDFQLLEELVYRESLQEHYKRIIGKLTKTTDNKDAEIVPKKILDSLNDNLDNIIKIKDKLGLFEDKTQADPLAYLKNLKKKFKIWLKENAGSRSFPCPHCSKMVFLKIKTDKYDAIKHPFFRDKVLFNKPLLEAYISGKPLTKEIVAQIIGASPDYVDWSVKKLEE